MTEKEIQEIERSYVLKHIPDALWVAARQKAMALHMPMGDVIIELLQQWVEKN